MINYRKHVFPFAIAVATGLTAATAFAQAPTDAQRSAIRSSCRSDYMAHCSSVQPGGAAALQCLQSNMASLSSGCQAAVKALSPAANAKPAADAKPAPDAKPAASPAAEAKPVESKPVESKPATIKSATTKPAADATGSMPPAAAAAAVTPVPASVAPVLVLRPLRPVEELRIVNAACGTDARAFCSAVEPGGGRVARCLASNAASLTPACRSMLAQFAAR